MSDKQNQVSDKLVVRRQRGRKGNNQINQGNDYVLKRYRLEENQHFKKKDNQQFNYQNVFDATPSKDEKQDQVEDELVIIPFDMPEDQPKQELEESQVEQPQTVYVFDDEQLSQNEENERNIPDRNDLFEPNFNIKPEKITQNKVGFLRHLGSNSHDSDLPFKITQRSNNSTAQLMTPKYIKSRNFLEGLKENGENFDGNKRYYYEKEEEEEQGQLQIKGVQIQEGSQQNAINIVDKHVFSISKLPSGIILRCIIKRTNNFLNMLSPQYDLYLANGLKHILSVKKYPMRNRELFKFSTSPVKFSEPNLLSVMHANVNHNTYWMLNLPIKIGQLDLSIVDMVIGYSKMKENESQRRFTVLLPSMNTSYQLALGYQQSNINFANFKEEINVQLNNLQHWQNQADNSSKNFVLADDDDPDYRYLELKKESDSIFELTIQHPLSPLQAMAIAMTRFDVQLK